MCGGFYLEFLLQKHNSEHGLSATPSAFADMCGNCGVELHHIEGVFLVNLWLCER